MPLEGEFEAAVSELLNTLISIVHGQAYSSLTLIVVHLSPLLFSTLSSEDNLKSPRLVNCKVSGFVLISECMSANYDRFLPSRDQPRNILDDDGFSKDCSVEDVADSAVWTLPHLFKSELFYTGLIRGDGGAFDTYFILFDSFGSLNGYFVLSSITVLHAEVIISNSEVEEGEDEFILDGFPYNSGHFIAVHFDDWIDYLYFSLLHYDVNYTYQRLAKIKKISTLTYHRGKNQITLNATRRSLINNISYNITIQAYILKPQIQFFSSYLLTSIISFW